ncbi:MAG: hypothetical protein HOP15_05215 [Planctomycetes bacterium]|nr:hypothetical protein [Planctomycetota bacterium]
MSARISVMGIGRFFLHDFFTAAELNLLEDQLTRRNAQDSKRHKSAKARVEALESDLERVALLTRALADLCLSKGLLTRDELIGQIQEADLADGKRDERLQAKVVMPGESKPADPDPSRVPSAKKARMKRSRPYP